MHFRICVFLGHYRDFHDTCSMETTWCHKGNNGTASVEKAMAETGLWEDGRRKIYDPWSEFLSAFWPSRPSAFLLACRLFTHSVQQLLLSLAWSSQLTSDSGFELLSCFATEQPLVESRRHRGRPKHSSGFSSGWERNPVKEWPRVTHYWQASYACL